MAAHTVQSTRSRRFIKIYLGTWGLLAVGALGYLAMLAFPRQADAPLEAAVQTARSDVGDSASGDPGLGDPKSDLQSGSTAPVEAQDSPQTEIHKDVAQPPDAAGEGKVHEKSAPTRLSALEKQAPQPTIGVTPRPTSVPGITIAGAPTVRGATDTMAVRTGTPGSTPLPDASAAVQEGAAPTTAVAPPFVPIETGSIAPPAATAAPETTTAPPRIVKVAPVRVAPVSVVPDTADAAPEARPESGPPSKSADADRKAENKTVDVARETEAKPVKTPPAAGTRTASLAPEAGDVAPKEEIVFGEPVVTRGGHEFAVQLAASPSVKALRRSWGKMAERHADALGRLQPRVIPPGPGSGVYRLLAGPVPSKAEAERICEELAVGPNGCFATNYAGAPL